MDMPTELIAWARVDWYSMMLYSISASGDMCCASFIIQCILRLILHQLFYLQQQPQSQLSAVRHDMA